MTSTFLNSEECRNQPLSVNYNITYFLQSFINRKYDEALNYFEKACIAHLRCRGNFFYLQSNGLEILHSAPTIPIYYAFQHQIAKSCCTTIAFRRRTLKINKVEISIDKSKNSSATLWKQSRNDITLLACDIAIKVANSAMSEREDLGKHNESSRQFHWCQSGLAKCLREPRRSMNFRGSGRFHVWFKWLILDLWRWLINSLAKSHIKKAV